MLAKIFTTVISLVIGATAAAQAADWRPDRNVTLVVGFSAGGPTDIPARFIAEKLGALLGQRVIVDNKPGAAGQLATRYVLSQPRDGHTLLLCTHYEPINTAVYKKPGYELSDIAPISQISKYYNALAVPNTLPADTLGEFIKYAKGHPNAVNYATIGIGAPQELVARRLQKLANISMVSVAYRSGPQAMPDLLAGRIQLYVAPTLAITPLFRQKKVKLLAVTSPERLPELPDIPTLTEKGLHYSAFNWLGICTGKGTPKQVVDTLNRDVVSIVNGSDYQNLIKRGGAIPVSSTPDELEQVMQNTYQDTAAIVREFKIERR